MTTAIATVSLSSPVFSSPRLSAVIDAEGSIKQAFFRVFDGHGGAKAAEFAAKHMDAKIMEEITKSGSDIQKEIRDAYLKTDEEFMRRNNDDDVSGGACCVSALIYKGSLIVSNAGDCRAVISQGGVAEAVTSDHRPSANFEREKIEDEEVDAKPFLGATEQGIRGGIMIAGEDEAVEVGVLVLEGAPEDPLAAAAVVGVKGGRR